MVAEDIGDYRVAVDGSVVTAATDAATDAALAICFDVAARYCAVPVSARRARLRMTVTTLRPRVEVRGELALAGRLMDRDVELTASFTAAGALPTASDLDWRGFDRIWNVVSGSPGVWAVDRGRAP